MTQIVVSVDIETYLSEDTLHGLLTKYLDRWGKVVHVAGSVSADEYNKPAQEEPESEFVPILQVSLSDLQGRGFDTTGMTHAALVELAEDCDNEHLINAYWLAIDYAAERAGLERLLYCAVCDEEIDPGDAASSPLGSVHKECLDEAEIMGDHNQQAGNGSWNDGISDADPGL